MSTLTHSDFDKLATETARRMGAITAQKGVITPDNSLTGVATRLIRDHAGNPNAGALLHSMHDHLARTAPDAVKGFLLAATHAASDKSSLTKTFATESHGLVRNLLSHARNSHGAHSGEDKVFARFEKVLGPAAAHV